MDLEQAACTPLPISADGFNPRAVIPYGCSVDMLHTAMVEFVDFLGYLNLQLHKKKIARLESMLMPANFSSLVGEFMCSAIPNYCSTLVKNLYHNGHPDLIPAGMFANDAAQYANEGIEIKASRYHRGWQGHNPEATWLMVFVFASNRPSDLRQQIGPQPFEFLLVAGARLEETDWRFSGRSGQSRRTITASVTQVGYEKMMSNWIYKAPNYSSGSES